MLAALTKYYANEQFDALVPVPLHPARRRERGYNQAELLAKAMAAETGFPIIAHELRRIRATPSQTKLDRHARAENVKDAFALAKDLSFTGLKILLVDDVYTTGATLNECARMLREAGAASVFALTFCRATLI
jgi:ComF family protein